MRPIRLLVALLVVACLPVATADAQAPADSFAALQPGLKVGQRVLVTNANGISSEGRVVSIAGDRLEIKQGGTWLERERRLVYTERDVRRIENADGIWNGVLIGGAVGLLLAIWEVNTPSSDEGTFGASLALFPFAGGQVGKWIDERIRRRLYVAPAGQRVVVAPALGPGRIGVVAQMRF